MSSVSNTKSIVLKFLIERTSTSRTSTTARIDTFILRINHASPNIASISYGLCQPSHTNCCHQLPLPHPTHTNKKIIPFSGLTPTHTPTTYIKRLRPPSQHSRHLGENLSLPTRMVLSFFPSFKQANLTSGKRKQLYGFSSTISTLNRGRSRLKRPNHSWISPAGILVCTNHTKTSC